MTLPLENLDNKSFKDLVRDALARIPVYSPEWTDHNETDPGITFMELLAWISETQMYRLNKVPEKSYLKFLKLTGIRGLRLTKAAKAEVTFSLRSSQSARIPAGTRLAATDPDTGEKVIFETEDDLDLSPSTFSKKTAAIRKLASANCITSPEGLNLHITSTSTPALGELDGSVKVRLEEDSLNWSQIDNFDALMPIVEVLDGELASKVSITDCTAAFGGDDQGTLQEAITGARTGLKEVTRAVTSSDYEYLAMRIPGFGVARAKALPGYHPRCIGEVPDTVSIAIVPYPDGEDPRPIPNSDFRKAVYRYLDKHRMMGTEIFIIAPNYVEISVMAAVIMVPGYRRDTVQNAVTQRLMDFIDPIRGGEDGKGWPFGRAVYLSEIYSIIDSVKGVDYVKKVTLCKDGVKQPVDAVISAHSLAFSRKDKPEVKPHVIRVYSIDEYSEERYKKDIEDAGDCGRTTPP